MTISEGTIHFEHVGIGTALQRNRLIVPVNQREYSWEKKHILDLFHDFSRAIEANKPSYFLGTIVLTSGEDETFEVADGQQRLATTTILLAAIRDYLDRKGDDLLVRSLEDDFLFKVVRETRETPPRLLLNLDDREFFRKRILARPKTPERKVNATKESHHRIVAAAELAAKHVQDVLRSHNESHHVTRLNAWVKFIEQAAQIVLMKVPDDVNAFVMFETLNDRGLKTSQADLLKNYLYGEAGDRLVEAQQKWSAMKGAIEALEVDDITLTYLRHLTISLYGHTRDREVFEKIKDKAAGKGKAIEFLDVLAENATDYAALVNPDHARWNGYQPSIREHIRTMNLLRVTQLRPLMLATVRKLAPREAEKAFRLFVCWSARFFIAGGGRVGQVEETYAEAAKGVTNGTLKTAAEIAAAVAKVVPTDAEFQSAFEIARVSQGHLARYYLRSLEMKYKGNPEPEWQPVEQTYINLEHVLPENPGNNWPHIEPGTAEAYYKRIGNMVLLQSTKNSIIGNSTFADKRDVLKASGYLLTAEVGKKASWGPKEIEAQQKKLAALAVETWSLAVK